MEHKEEILDLYYQLKESIERMGATELEHEGALYITDEETGEDIEIAKVVISYKAPPKEK